METNSLDGKNRKNVHVSQAVEVVQKQHQRSGELTEGMAIMQHPTNKWYPSPWFTRDYGFFSPTPMYWPEDNDNGTVFQKGESLKLRYRVLVHAGNTLDAGITEAFSKYIKE